jgi:hypothetical protein
MVLFYGMRKKGGWKEEETEREGGIVIRDVSHADGEWMDDEVEHTSV